MTICVAVKVSEGLVLAADSAATIHGELHLPNGEVSIGILKTYEHARKLSHVKDYPIGTLSWGLSLIGPRSVESLIKEYEYSLQSLQEEQEKAHLCRLEGRAEVDPFRYQVRDIAQGLFQHIKKFYEANLPEDKRSPLGILVSGYSSDQFFPEQFMIQIPESPDLKELRKDVNGKPNFGADWFGLTDAMTRLHWGRDQQVVAIIADRFKVEKEEVRQLLEPLQYQIVFDGMPLQDAIDFAVYVVNVVIGRYRFVLGAPLCGGEIDVAVITPDNFTWINRKAWKIDNRIS
ncbi:MAG: hypothetical protein C4575_12990 [Desulforudis sp.]|jgi:hypothetical protein|nr:MAG: hypothetical protein C4575_12990 [Desulforudis sp.]